MHGWMELVLLLLFFFYCHKTIIAVGLTFTLLELQSVER